MTTIHALSSRNGNDENSIVRGRSKDTTTNSNMLESTKNLVGVDKKGNQRALFLYDGGCGV